MIDEKKLIAEMEKLPLIHGRYDKKNANPYFINGAESMYEMIRELVERQPKVNEWIPCRERLPDEEARQYIINNLDGIGYLYPCLLTYRSPNTEKVHVVRFYYDIDMQCFVNHGEKMCEKARCIAWMPLPEPWEGE